MPGSRGPRRSHAADAARLAHTGSRARAEGRDPARDVAGGAPSLRPRPPEHQSTEYSDPSGLRRAAARRLQLRSQGLRRERRAPVQAPAPELAVLRLSGADRPDEPLGRLPDRPLLARRRPIRAVDGNAALQGG